MTTDGRNFRHFFFAFLFNCLHFSLHWQWKVTKIFFTPKKWKIFTKIVSIHIGSSTLWLLTIQKTKRVEHILCWGILTKTLALVLLMINMKLYHRKLRIYSLLHAKKLVYLCKRQWRILFTDSETINCIDQHIWPIFLYRITIFQFGLRNTFLG